MDDPWVNWQPARPWTPAEVTDAERERRAGELWEAFGYPGTPQNGTEALRGSEA